MSRVRQNEAVTEPADSQLEEATQWFLRVRSESARVEDLPDFKGWIESDPRNRLAYQQVSATWAAIGQVSWAPEIIVGRHDALNDARRAARRRWSVRRGMPRYGVLAASVIIALVGAFAWLYSQRGVYSTDLGERRALTLADGSVVTLDAKSRVRVQYEQDQRVISLERGQARFDVAKDPTRPFRVRAGAQTVIALGTQFNVELVAGNVLVSMIEGHVAITGLGSTALSPVQSARSRASAATKQSEAAAGTARWKAQAVQNPGQWASTSLPTIELEAGEGLRVRATGQTVVLPKIDVERATAWQSGKMFFDNEPLASAAERFNRYSQLEIVVDESVAEVGISGVFNASDSNAFVEAISTYFPVHVERVSASKIRLSRN